MPRLPRLFQPRSRRFAQAAPPSTAPLAIESLLMSLCVAIVSMPMLQAKRARSRAARNRDHGFAISLMEHPVVPIFVIDGDGRVLIWNKARERLTGVAAREVIGGRDHWRAFYSEPRPRLADLVRARRFDEISSLYASGADFSFGDLGVSAENWCVMPRFGRRLYLAIDAGP